MSLSRLLHDHRLTTAQIVYHLPDHPHLLQEFIWQDYDLAPNFPELRRFLAFWEKEIDGPLHSVRVMSASLITTGELKVVHQEFRLH